MKIYNRWDFLAWEEAGETALALVNRRGWFHMAFNCMRDGDMGHKDADGIYEIGWATDWLPPRAKTRPMTEPEVDIYIRHLKTGLGLEWEWLNAPECHLIRGHKECYVLIEVEE